MPDFVLIKNFPPFTEKIYLLCTVVLEKKIRTPLSLLQISSYCGLLIEGKKNGSHKNSHPSPLRKGIFSF